MSWRVPLSLLEYIIRDVFFKILQQMITNIQAFRISEHTYSIINSLILGLMYTS